MATTATNPSNNTQELDTLTSLEPLKGGDKASLQSVFVADKNIVRTYPREMSNDEIDFDLHTTVRGKTPEDYYLNFLPLKALQTAFKGLTNPMGLAADYADEYKAFENETITPALKLAAIRPDVAFGITKENVEVQTGTGGKNLNGIWINEISHPLISEKELAMTYGPWLDIWRESALGKPATEWSDKFLSDAPAPIAAIPWFIAEFVPDQLLEFGTKPSSWITAWAAEKGVQQFGPPLINKILSWLPKETREFFLKDIFAGEKAMAKDFETLGIKINAKTSDVVNAYKNASKVAHPDVGGSAEEFKAINDAYRNIMQSRGGIMDKFFDMFRGSPKETPATAQRKVSGLLGNQSGSAMVPFSEGDLIKMGEKVGQIVKLSGNIASVNIAGRVIHTTIEKLSPIAKEPASGDAEAGSVVPEQEASVNLEKLKVSDDARLNLIRGTEVIKEQLENQTGKPMTHQEVVEKAKEAEVFTKGVSREATLDFQASLLKTRQQLAALAQEEKITPEFLETLRTVSNMGTDIARNLGSFNISAVPELHTAKIKVIQDLQKLGIESKDILAAAKGVDFNDEASLTKFYRKFVKPSLGEILDEYVYMNILSSPKTHIVNTSSNILQLIGLNPLTKLAVGTIDAVASGLTGKDREHYISEIPAFYKGAANAFPQAFKTAADVMRGKKTVDRPDLKGLPTLSKFTKYATLGLGKYIPRALEASDVLFRTMIEGGELESALSKLTSPATEKQMLAAKKKAKDKSEYYVFRKAPDAANETGQGALLSEIDKMTNAIYRMREVAGLKWFIRFVQTPMAIAKQGLEYSPLGVATLPGAKDKTEQAGKAALGSIVFAGASWLALAGRSTWGAPRGEKERNEFYAAGLQPYSLRIGDRWYSYSKLGPIAYPIAMAAALHYFLKDSPKSLSDSELDKLVDGLTGIMSFFSDQSYMQGLSDLMKFTEGDKSKAVSSIPSQLVPLSSLQGWVNQIIDEIQRKPDKGLSIDAIVDNIQMKLVGMSRFVPAQIDSDEMPVKKKSRVLNAASPVQSSKVNKAGLAEYRETVQSNQESNLSKKESET